MSDWQPIESAPPMLTVILFAATDVNEDGTIRNWRMGSGHLHKGYRNEPPCWAWEGQWLKSYDTQPTHWMPLPAPPVQS